MRRARRCVARRGRAVFGRSRAAAEIEGSKAFAKELMARHAVPTARFGRFRQLPEAELFIDELTREARGDGRVVVKADGLAAGKGVVVAATPTRPSGELRQHARRRHRSATAGRARGDRRAPRRARGVADGARATASA